MQIVTTRSTAMASTLLLNATAAMDSVATIILSLFTLLVDVIDQFFLVLGYLCCYFLLAFCCIGEGYQVICAEHIWPFPTLFKKYHCNIFIFHDLFIRNSASDGKRKTRRYLKLVILVSSEDPHYVDCDKIR